MTFEQVWRQAWLTTPGIPSTLVEAWAQQAYQKVLQRRDAWSWLRVKYELRTVTLRQGTAGVTQDATTVTPGTLTFSTSDVGLQFRVAAGPLYTVLSVDGGAATLDRPWIDPTNPALLCQVYRAYATMPAGFKRWMYAIDRISRVPVRLYTTGAELDAWDGRRERFDALRLHFASYPPAADGRIRFEIWPHQTTERVVHGMYVQAGTPFVDESLLPQPLTLELLLAGTLAEAASWPGTSAQKNPYFNLQLAQMKRGEFEELLHRVEMADEEFAPSWLVTPEARSAVNDTMLSGFPRMAYDD